MVFAKKHGLHRERWMVWHNSSTSVPAESKHCHYSCCAWISTAWHGRYPFFQTQHVYHATKPSIARGPHLKTISRMQDIDIQTVLTDVVWRLPLLHFLCEPLHLMRMTIYIFVLLTRLTLNRPHFLYQGFATMDNVVTVRSCGRLRTRVLERDRCRKIYDDSTVAPFFNYVLQLRNVWNVLKALLPTNVRDSRIYLTGQYRKYVVQEQRNGGHRHI